MTAPDGHPHNAIRGLFTTITRLVERFNARGVVAAWDDDWRPQWRVDLIPSYKTHRVVDQVDLAQNDVAQGTVNEATTSVGSELEPETLGPQIGAIAAILDAWGLPRLGAAGFEADDIAATVARIAQAPVIVVTGDRDLIQLVRPGVQVLLTAKGGMENWPLLDSAGVFEKYGLPPERYVEFAVLRGDASDGLPGVKGVGEKTALALLQAHPTLADLITAAETQPVTKPLTPRIAEAIVNSRAYLSAAQTVTTLRDDVALALTDLTPPPSPRDPDALSQILREWGVERFVSEAMNSLDVSRSEPSQQ
jgi:5'-3' exonuclease